MIVSKRNLLFQGLIFRFHVKLKGCSPKMMGKEDDPFLPFRKKVTFQEFLLLNFREDYSGLLKPMA